MIVLKPNETFDKRFTLIERIGYGGFSEVWKVKRETGFVQALKVFTRLDKEGAALAVEEFEKVFNLNHNRLLKASDVGVFEGCPYLVMPYCKEGSALKKIDQLGERELVKLMTDISSALGFLHALPDPIIHQDIKPDNFLIDDNGNYLLADFGISKNLKQRLSLSIQPNRDTVLQESDKPKTTGTAPPAYRPPETFSADFQERKPIFATDVWAFGASLFELATGELPFGEFGGIIQQQGVAVPNLPKDRYSQTFNEIVKRCLSEHPWNRPTAVELEKIGHQYLETNIWDVRLSSQPAPTPKKQEEKSKKRWLLLLIPLTIIGLTVGYMFWDKSQNKPISDTENVTIPVDIGDSSVILAEQGIDRPSNPENLNPGNDILKENDRPKDDTEKATPSNELDRSDEQPSDRSQTAPKSRDKSQGNQSISNDVTSNQNGGSQFRDVIPKEKDNKIQPQPIEEERRGENKEPEDNDIKKPLDTPENPPKEEQPKVEERVQPSLSKSDINSFRRSTQKVYLTPNTNLDLSNAQAGQIITFRVAGDIRTKSGSNVIIRKNTLVEGKIAKLVPKREMLIQFDEIQLFLPKQGNKSFNLKNVSLKEKGLSTSKAYELKITIRNQREIDNYLGAL